MPHLDELSDEITDQYGDSGVLRSIGSGTQQVRVVLRADAAPVAARLRARYGDLVDLTVGALPYPPSRLASHQSTKRRERQGPTASGDRPDLEVRAELDADEVPAGADLRGRVRVRNAGRTPTSIRTDSVLTGWVVTSTGVLVGRSTGAIAGTGLDEALAPGQSVEIPFIGGTAGYDSYGTPPGDYYVVVPVPIGNGRLLTPPVPLRVLPAVPAFESVSTWRQPLPETASTGRRALLRELAEEIAQLSSGRIRVAVDGYTAAGKTTFSHELAAALREYGRPTARASLDDFKHPWRHAREHGYDRVSGAGYYRNAFDLESAVELLLRPAGPDGSGDVVLCAYDPLTGTDHRDRTVALPPDAVLVVDGVFALRPELDAWWNHRVWLDLDPELSLERGIARDADREGLEEATRLHRDRYHAAEEIYLREVDPRTIADVVIHNTDFSHPRRIR